ALGKTVHGSVAGAMSSVVLATSPAFLWEAAQPMSDVPATAWWALSLMLVLSKQTALGALGSGLAAAMAILTRPNLVPLAAIIGIWLGLCVMATRGLDRRRQATRLALFVCGVLPGCFAVAALNQYLYGSALRSGYAPLHALYAWSNAA